MQRGAWSRATVCVLASLLVGLMACSAESTSSSASNVTAKPKAPKPKATATAAPGPVTAAIQPKGSDAACKGQAGDACTACCEKAHPAGAKAYDDLYYACLCEATRCATECAKTECLDDDNSPPPTPGDACDLCVKKYSNDEGTGTCDGGLRPKCSADVECSAFLACQDECD